MNYAMYLITSHEHPEYPHGKVFVAKTDASPSVCDGQYGIIFIVPESWVQDRNRTSGNEPPTIRETIDSIYEYYFGSTTVSTPLFDIAK